MCEIIHRSEFTNNIALCRLLLMLVLSRHTIRRIKGQRLRKSSTMLMAQKSRLGVTVKLSTKYGITTMLRDACKLESLNQLTQARFLFLPRPPSPPSSNRHEIIHKDDTTDIRRPTVGGGSNCPSDGIHYIPKYSSSPRPTKTNGPGRPKPTRPAESRKGNLRVYMNDQQQRGCLISRGSWFVSGTCATFKATDVSGTRIPPSPL